MSRKKRDPSIPATQQQADSPRLGQSPPERKVLNVHKAAAFLGVSESIIRRLIRERRIPFFQIEGRYLFYQPALELWIEDHMVHPVSASATEVAAGTANDIWDHSQGG